MSAKGKLYGGRLIGAAGMTLLFWALPLVTFALAAKMNPESAGAQHLAQSWAGKNQSVLLGILVLISVLSLFFDRRMARKGTATLKQSLIFGSAIAALQWFNAFMFGERQEFWVVNTAYNSLVLFSMVVVTRLIAREVDHLEEMPRGLSQQPNPIA